MASIACLTPWTLCAGRFCSMITMSCGRELGNERLFDIGEKGLAAHRAGEYHGRSDAVVTQPGSEGGGFPMAMTHRKML